MSTSALAAPISMESSSPTSSTASLSTAVDPDALRSTLPRPLSAKTIGTASGNIALPPMMRKIVNRSKVASRPPSVSGLVPTREMKLESAQRELRAQQERQAATLDEIEARRATVNGFRPMSSSSSVAIGMIENNQAAKDLGPLYSQFQMAAQQTGADLANGFPALIRTAFERTSYWKNAPPTQSAQLGTVAWIFLHYALNSPEEVPLVTTIEQLESESLRLSFRQWLFLCTDLELVPQLTSKTRIAALYQTYGVDNHVDIGMNYLSTIKCFATIATEAQFVPRELGVDPSSQKLPAKDASANQNAKDKTVAFLHYVRWDSLEWVCSTLEAKTRVAWYRKRAELTDAKSVYVHKPTCLFRHDQPVALSAGRGDYDITVRSHHAASCPHCHAPHWKPLEQQLVEGVRERHKVLHVTPHGHAHHSITLGAKPKPVKSAKPSVADLRQAQGSTKDLAEEKTQSPQSQSSGGSGGNNNAPTSSSKSLGRSSSATLLTASPLGSSTSLREQQSPQEPKAPRPESAMYPRSPPKNPLSRDEQTALKIIRKLERLPLEDQWCSFPGGYIDMGVIEVLPPITDLQFAASKKEREPHALAETKLRPHKYLIELKNRVTSGLKISVAARGCEWLQLEYPPRTFLSLGVSTRISVLAPQHLPFDAVSVATAKAAMDDAPLLEGVPVRTRGIGKGVEKMGEVVITAENQWTYEVSQISIPVYARLVLKGTSNQLTSGAVFEPIASAPVTEPNSPKLIAANSGNNSNRSSATGSISKLRISSSGSATPTSSVGSIASSPKAVAVNVSRSPTNAIEAQKALAAQTQRLQEEHRRNRSNQFAQLTEEELRKY